MELYFKGAYYGDTRCGCVALPIERGETHQHVSLGLCYYISCSLVSRFFGHLERTPLKFQLGEKQIFWILQKESVIVVFCLCPLKNFTNLMYSPSLIVVMFIRVDFRMSLGTVVYNTVTRRFSTILLASAFGAYAFNYSLDGLTNFYWDTVSLLFWDIKVIFKF